LPLSYVRIAFFELSELVVLDRLLLVCIFAAFILCLRNIKSKSTPYFFAILFAVWSLAAINGTVGTNFRYELPLLPFAFWAIIESLNYRERIWHVEE
jgi:hypothetical protein